MHELVVVAVLFILGLVAAWLLFRILQSTAAITRKDYQLGGAAAGFLIIYSALYYSYRELARIDVEGMRAEAASCATSLSAAERELPIGGTVSPVLKNATVVLAVKTITLPDDGRFRLPAKGIDLKRDAVSIYVIGENQHGYYQLFPDDDPSRLKITLAQTVASTN